MAITIKAEAMKYRNSGGTYTGFDAIAQETTAQQVANIQSAGATQIGAVEAKGVETLDSIPDDYTALQAEVDDVQRALDNAVGAIVFSASHTYVSGPANWQTIALNGARKLAIRLIDNTNTSIEVNAHYSNAWRLLTTITDNKFHVVNIPATADNMLMLTYRGSTSVTITCVIVDMTNAGIASDIIDLFDDVSTLESAVEAITSASIKSRSNILTDPTFDINAINTNLLIRLNFALNSTNIPANLPFSKWESERVALLLTSVKTEGTLNAGDSQILFTSKAGYLRNYIAAWTDWTKLYDNSDLITYEYTVDINGTGDYTSLCACIDTAVTHENSVIYVKRGTYNAITEMTALKGATYFDDFASNTDQIYVRNGCKVICEPGTVLTANYTGSNEYVKSYYAPINFSNSDGYIEGLEIDASNCRYCIHDDQWTRTEPYKHTIKNCRLIIDNSANTDWDRRLAFGGGFGVNGYVVFENCYFKSVGLDGTAYSGYGSMGYHNSPDANAQSTLIVNNCYFADNSTFRLTRHGSSTKITRAFVSGCSLGREMELTYEQSSSTPLNCEIIDCNNIIRS